VLDLVLWHVLDHAHRRHRGSSDEPRAQVAGLVAEILGDGLAEELGELPVQIVGVGRERLALADQPLREALLVPQRGGIDLRGDTRDASPQGVEEAEAEQPREPREPARRRGPLPSGRPADAGEG
jgi:hypothetical protein